ncbi:Transmembrane channel-like protein 5 [Frankliniella fusca]|uniref:Transmembrane channel-like protein 5 n=1 Tax=Frankliniella fusca TaxID=407009 RepID=A0AAE1LNA6_9NEOP|nr:Transmembrane channel-like protein 5 [Frankliniella fusca]
MTKMDRPVQDNRANQCNPNHSATGSGRSSGYTGSRANENNRANQKNPNNPQYSGGNKKK